LMYSRWSSDGTVDPFIARKLPVICENMR